LKEVSAIFGLFVNMNKISILSKIKFSIQADDLYVCKWRRSDNLGIDIKRFILFNFGC